MKNTFRTKHLLVLLLLPLGAACGAGTPVIRGQSCDEATPCSAGQRCVSGECMSESSAGGGGANDGSNDGTGGSGDDGTATGGDGVTSDTGSTGATGSTGTSTATCSDGVHNGDETGVDCGGGCPACATPTGCSDGIQNGDETGVDCGGGCAACPAPASCSDGVQNGDETDLDCGGGCDGCGPGGACVDGGDCLGGDCDTMSSACAASCFDRVKNGAETDIDCGGDCAANCPTNAGCAGDADCASGNCNTTASVCEAPSCSDNLRNGDETGIDCGGSCVNEGRRCAAGAACTSPNDCAGSVCSSFVCQPSCSDGALNGDETGVDCGGACAVLGRACADGGACVVDADCASGDCTSSTCVAPGGCSGSCGDPGCSPCGAGSTCTTGTTCQSGVCGVGAAPNGDNCPDGPACECAAASCADGVRNGAETDVDCGGPSCADCAEGASCQSGADCASGACATGTCVAPVCGNAAITGNEVCDGANLNGQSCLSRGFIGGGTLACAGDCLSFDTSGCSSVAVCSPSCTASQTCIAGECTCTQGLTACGQSCVDTVTNPDNCGACGNACANGSFCASGGCVPSCPPPLVGVDRRCVDNTSDNNYCGPNNTPCPSGQVCNNGACQAPAATLTRPAKCIGAGPPVSIDVGIGTGGSLDCLGNLAANTFRWGVCACSSISITQPFTVDSFNSRVAPYSPASMNCTGTFPALSCAPSTTGGSVASNGFIELGAESQVFGQMSAANAVNPRSTALSANKRLEVASRLASGSGVLMKNQSYVVDSARVAGNIAAGGGMATVGFLDDLFAPALGASSVAGDFVTTPNVTVTPACDCGANQLLDLISLINQRACTGSGAEPCAADTLRNDNHAAGLHPDLFRSGSNIGGDGGRIDLDCGVYYLSTITESSVTINVNGNVALFVGGQVAASQGINFALGAGASLDLFILDSVCTTQNARFGSVNYPARSRVYVAAGQPGLAATSCAGTVGMRITQSGFLAGNFYAPYGTIRVPQEIDLYGGVFANVVEATQDWRVHFDRAVIDQGDICSTCGNGKIEPGEQCEGSNTLGRTCQQLGYSGGVLGCNAATCQFDVSQCFRCGDGVKGGSEQCDGSDLGSAPPTCAGLGFSSGEVVCGVDCRFDSSDCSNQTAEFCGDGVINGNEICDPGAAPSVPPALPNGTSCVDYGMPWNGGTIACSASCELDTRSCTFCGDGVINGSEQCDGQSTNGATCDGVLMGSGYSGFVTCRTDCSFDTSYCSTEAQCTSCSDCGELACVGGACGPCTTNDDCCSGLECQPDGKCGQACQVLGGSCQSDSDCCNGGIIAFCDSISQFCTDDPGGGNQ